MEEEREADGVSRIGLRDEHLRVRPRTEQVRVQRVTVEHHLVGQVLVGGERTAAGRGRRLKEVHCHGFRTDA